MYSLTFLLALLPAAITAPTTDRRSCCQEESRDIEWSITDLYFHSADIFSTPAHQIPSGYISFNLTNPVTETVTECSAYSTQLSDYYYGNFWYQCTNTTGVGATSFRYDRPTGRVDVNQTWTCNDGPDPVTFTASGNATKVLTCTNTEYHNPNWTTPGTTYAAYYTECDKVDLTVTPYLITAVA